MTKKDMLDKIIGDAGGKVAVQLSLRSGQVLGGDLTNSTAFEGAYEFRVQGMAGGNTPITVLNLLVADDVVTIMLPLPPEPASIKDDSGIILPGRGRSS
jgi:hypothetical protein